MTVLDAPDEEELYLLAIMDDPSGIDLAEFLWVDEENDDRCFRAWDYQWAWYHCEDVFQIDQAARSMGKTVGITMRACAFPLVYPGSEMLITAPELNHLRPLVDKIETTILGVRLLRELLPNIKGAGINHQPQFQARFANGARIISRLPNKDGKGVKGMHPLILEADEMQDYPEAGWIELIETLKRGSKGAQWRCHGVSRGVRDRYYKQTQEQSGWTVHRFQAMYRPSWSDQERTEKIETYGGSRDNPDFKRNIYGEHGDATNPVFVLARLMACVDLDQGSEYNQDVYRQVRVNFELLQSSGLDIRSFLDLPASHKVGYSDNPGGYSAYYGGMDVGMTNHPSEILVYGQRAKAKTEVLELLLRVQLHRIDTENQMAVIEEIFRFYGAKMRVFSIDRTGLGFSLWDLLSRRPGIGSRIKGYNFSGKYVVGFEDRPMERDETWEDLGIERNIVEYASDQLREFVDSKRMRLPFDQELLTEWQGQSYTIVKSTGSPYGKRDYSRGKFHTLDAGKMMIAGRQLESVEETLTKKPVHTPVLDRFAGAMY